MQIRLTLDTDNIMPAIIETILELLKEKHLSLGEYAAISGLSVQMISDLLYGKTKSIKPDTLAKLIRGFDMSYNQFAALVVSYNGDSGVGE